MIALLTNFEFTKLALTLSLITSTQLINYKIGYYGVSEHYPNKRFELHMIGLNENDEIIFEYNTYEINNELYSKLLKLQSYIINEMTNKEYIIQIPSDEEYISIKIRDKYDEL